MTTKPSDDPTQDGGVVKYWGEIAASWTETVRSGGIPSRKFVTDAAIVRAILDRNPNSVLDLGCGEGWLCRALAERGVTATGIDAVPELIEEARAAGGASYHVFSYEDLVDHPPSLKVDLIVCNFSLLGKESVENLLSFLPQLLRPNGSLIIQTLHPVIACGDAPYEDGWRQSPWTGITTHISKPSPWYFRTLESWVELVTSRGFGLVELKEPIHPETGRPASLILVTGR